MNKNIKKQAKNVAESVGEIGKRELKRKLNEMNNSGGGKKKRSKKTLFDV